MRDVRNTVYAELDEYLTILLRLIRDESVTCEEVEAFCNKVASIEKWARTCRELISLGDIYVYSRAYRTDWYRRLIAANSSLL